MKKSILFLLGLVAAFCACHPQQDSLIGTWTVDKVNVQFDEKSNTPELVKQVGEMEKGNTLSISPDSLLKFKGLDEEWEGRISLNGDGTLLCDGKAIGIWKEGQIVTRTNSPLGEITISYRKTD